MNARAMSKASENPATATHSSEYKMRGRFASGNRAAGWSALVRVPKPPDDVKITIE